MMGFGVKTGMTELFKTPEKIHFGTLLQAKLELS